MASFSTTELNATVDEKWQMDVEDARYASAVILPRVSNKSDMVRKSGDIINVTVDQKYTVGDVGSNGAFVPQVLTPTSVAVTINQYRQVAIEVEDRAEAASFYSPESRFPKDAGAAMAVDVDDKIAALHTDVTTNVVGSPSTPSAFDSTLMRAAMLKLADTNIPLSELAFILPPIAFYSGILAEAQLTGANTSGSSKEANITGARFPLLGIPAFESTVLKTVTNARKGFLLHKTAFAVALQKNSEIARADRTSALVFSFVVAIKSLFGVKTIREDHACVINIKKT